MKKGFRSKIVSLHERGGRCLYANITKGWSEEEYALVCKAVRNLVDSLRVKRFINDGKIGLSDFDYMKYKGCEIIL